jgi:hypothetical protein
MFTRAYVSLDADKIVGNGPPLTTESYIHCTEQTGNHGGQRRERARQERVSPSYESITVSDVEPLHRACDDVG